MSSTFSTPLSQGPSSLQNIQQSPLSLLTMAGPLVAVDLQLPENFLGEKDVILGKDEKGMKGFGTESDFPSHIFPTEFPYQFDSPVESSTETDSSEDEFFVGLSRRLSRSSSQKLVPGLIQHCQQRKEKSGELATSPQSTLSGTGSWSFHSNGNSKSPSQVPSPTTTPFPAQDDAWDLISAAAGQVARLKMNSESPNCNIDAFYGRNLYRAQNHTNSNRNLAHILYQSNQFQHQVVKPRCDAVWGRRQVKPNWQTPAQYQQPPPIQSRARYGGQPQPHSNSRMRAVFLGGTGGAKRESTGTGVFLPRRYGNTPEYHKKSGCSTVLLPPKVVQALNLNLDNINPGFSLKKNY